MQKVSILLPLEESLMELVCIWENFNKKQYFYNDYDYQIDVSAHYIRIIEKCRSWIIHFEQLFLLRRKIRCSNNIVKFRILRMSTLSVYFCNAVSENKSPHASWEIIEDLFPKKNSFGIWMPKLFAKQL